MNLGTITGRLKDLLEPCDDIYIHFGIDPTRTITKFYDLEVDVEYPQVLEIMPFLSQKVVIDETKEQVETKDFWFSYLLN